MNIQDHLNRLHQEIRQARVREIFFLSLLKFSQGFCCLLLLDILVHLDNHFLRFILFLGVLLWVIREVRRKMSHPIHKDLSPKDLIKIYEKKYPQIQGRWMAAFQLAHQSEHPAVRQLQSESEKIAQAIPLSSLVVPGPFVQLKKSSLLWGMGLFLAILLVAPVRLAFKRIFIDSPWPLVNRLNLSQVQPVVVRGEPFDLKVTVDEDQRAASETTVTLFQSGEDIRKFPLLMNRQGSLFAQVDGIESDVQVVFEGGDFRSDPLSIAVVDRPQVQKSRVVGHYPNYVALSDVTFPSESSSYSFIQGGELTFELIANKTLSEAILATELGDFPMKVVGDRASVTVPLKSSGNWRVELMGEHGYRNKDPLHFLVEALPDQPPQISYKSPQRDLNLTPEAFVRIQGLIEDDYGIQTMKLSVDRVDLEGQRSASVVTLGEISGNNQTQRPFDSLFDFATEGAQPGEVYKFQVEGVDFFDQKGAGRQIAIQLVHPETVNEEIDGCLQAIRKILEKMVAREESILVMTSGLVADLPNLSLPTLSGALEKQNSQVKLVDEIFDLMDQVYELITLNRLKRDDVLRLLTLVAEELEKLQSKEIPSAVEALIQVRETLSEGNRALKAQEVCLNTLQNLLDKLGGSRGFMAVIQGLENVIQNEKKIRDLTKKVED